MTNAEDTNTTRRQSRQGVVSSAAGDKTIRVLVESLAKHPKYGKYMRRRSKIAAHDEANVAKVGDVVEIVPCRRLSKTKSWRLVRVVRQGTFVEPIA
jgi:small subunit ribosomal protein S17